jgi:hypothetical protein
LGHLADATSVREHFGVGLTQPEPLMSREEVVATMFNVSDIATDISVIRRVLEENGEEEEEQEGDR